ncbi:sorting nexin-10B-like isoform X1 [Gadus chalcogrammus]|uniref:sorting nexin-10B-like isoform X1 n=1 Tax=Gadus chalcogrammus TaxID=1042646 RepID=UPI0024C3567A|nr:sorting nexin-10B-like isoform X1 [Gadus chalcogrammus]
MKSHVRHFFGGGFPMVALPQYDIIKVPFFVFWLQLPASHTMQQDISVWVRDPRIQNTDFWHAYIDYEICLLTNSLCFTKKISCTRRRFSEFVWLRQRLQVHSLLISKLPQMPPKNLFFSLNSARQISERMKGLQTFLEQILVSPYLLSDSCVHLFLQSRLSVAQMDACVAGRTRYSVAQAIERGGQSLPRFPSTEDLNQGSSSSSYS